MAQFQQTTVFKLALLQEIAQRDKKLLARLVERCGEDYKKQYSPDKVSFDKAVDFEYMVGSTVFKGAYLEKFLKDEKVWSHYLEGIKRDMASDKVLSELRQREPEFDKLRRKNPSQANSMMLQALIDQKIPKMVKLAFMMKKAGKKGFSKAIVTALGEKELSKGVWVGLFRGMRDRGLSRTVGYGFKSALESGVVHATALIMQRPVLEYAKEHGLKHATKFKEMMKNTLSSVAMISAMALTMAQMPADTDIEPLLEKTKSFEVADGDQLKPFQDFVDDLHIEQLPKYADGDYSFEDLEPLDTELVTESLNLGGVDEEVKGDIDAMQLGQQSLGFASQVESLLAGVPQTYSAEEGDSLWKISSDIVTQALKGREYILDQTGDFNNMVANTVNLIVAENNIETPDLIQVDQDIKLPTVIVDGIKAKLGLAEGVVSQLASGDIKPDIKAGVSNKLTM